MKNISIEIPSLPDNIRIVESFVDNAKEKYALTDDLYGNIMIAVVESVNNAIVHGNKADKEKTVSLQAIMNEANIQFVISDQGPGFDSNDLPDPTAPENIENPGGRGIFLMKHLADEVSFSNEGRTVELTFYLD
ncbi:ATP-binding protein [Roseivirga pacifica]|uniref:ATP-binding protein n=1 Tax=Roseivirga pacifica TaxID=1267423 RepID=UPI002095F91B|nr:ATP-binding protein [Roseivirga pacifica]MCO6359265.1 ATP-binding protein [Roseivirga pacifica]MCO6365099.1 ATP-binding protein [Roseivirga pacifica]MCO6372171.1 ATP-binding protein [Roseivirga pacifica]MCO6375718.1 ATP-binding protein [Roseivirga pacifica]MCO6379549.1 ATP-binding protein [Roseivirga pacifica]